jgi:hypothetical protein
VEQAKALALHGHHPPDKSAFFQSHGQVGRSGSIQRTEPRKRNLIDSRMALKNAQHAILDGGYAMAHGRVEHGDSDLLGAPNQVARFVINFAVRSVVASGFVHGFGFETSRHCLLAIVSEPSPSREAVGTLAASSSIQ